MKKFPAVLSALVLAAGMGVMAPTAASAAPYCGITWGSMTKSAPDTASPEFEDVRAGRHSCYDRMVIDIDGRGAGYHVGYVTEVREDGSGEVVPLRGGADLSVIVTARAYDSSGESTYNPKNRDELANVSGYRTFRQIAFAGSFEGQTTVGLGVRARLPFRAFTLNSPDGDSRVVVDVAHSW